MEIDTTKLTFAAILYYLKHQELACSEDEVKRRFEICRLCERFQSLPEPSEEEREQVLKDYGTTKLHSCLECGCILEKKTTDLFQACPLLKWFPTIDHNAFIWGPGDGDQWKKYHDEIMKEYEKHGSNYINWMYESNLNPEDLEIIERVIMEENQREMNDGSTTNDNRTSEQGDV